MTITAEEIVISVDAEGSEEASREIEDVEDGVDDTTDGLEDSAGAMGRLQRRFSGLFQALTAGLAVLTGFLLTRIPVIDDAMAGLGAVLDAVALRLDGSVRPVISDIAEELFDLSEAIFEAESVAEGFLEVFETVINIEDILVEATVDFVLETEPEDWITTENIGRAFALWLDRQVRDVDLPVGTMGRVMGLWIDQSLDDAFDIDVGAWASGLIDDVSDWFGGLPSRAIEWGRGIVDGLQEGIAERIDALREWFEGIEIAAGFTVGDVSAAVDGGGGGGGGGGTLGLALQQSTGVSIDGRRLEERTARFSNDPNQRRGL